MCECRGVCVCVLCHRLYRWDNNLYWHESTASASCTCLLIFWIVGTKFYNNREHVNSSLRKICKKKKRRKKKERVREGMKERRGFSHLKISPCTQNLPTAHWPVTTTGSDPYCTGQLHDHRRLSR